MSSRWDSERDDGVLTKTRPRRRDWVQFTGLLFALVATWCLLAVMIAATWRVVEWIWP